MKLILPTATLLLSLATSAATPIPSAKSKEAPFSRDEYVACLQNILEHEPYLKDDEVRSWTIDCIHPGVDPKGFHEVYVSRRQQKAAEKAAQGAQDGEGDTREGERYFGIIKGAVRRFYDVSSTISEGERTRLSVDVVLRLDAEGGLIDVGLPKPSNNAVFNDAVVAAVKKAAPFGPPPSRLQGPLKKDGVQLRFTP